MSKDNTRAFLSVREVAELLNLTTATIYNWMADGKLPFVRTGSRTIRIHRDSLKAVVSAGAPPPGAKRRLDRQYGRTPAEAADTQATA
jgi:excisionase family DNA binding protein